MATDFVFPEDAGTGAAGGDNADAANFATLAYATGFVDLAVSGLTVTPDYAVPDFDLSAGLCVVTDASAQEAQTTEMRDQGVAYSVIVAARTGVALTDAAVNEVFIDVDLSSDDTLSITVTSDGSSPSQPYLKIAEVDTSNDTVTHYNTIQETNDVFASLSDIPNVPEGQAVWVQDEERYYYDDGN